jgi:RNA polymerase sigma-70 factor, ECF subfamily
MNPVTDDEFAAEAERYRRELRVHCYRMLGSYDDAEDLVQETYLKAWRRRSSLRSRGTFRPWLYRIATNACLDAIAARPPERRVAATAAGDGPPPAAVGWLSPYPDRLLDAVAPAEAEPDAVVVGRETISLAFLVAIQHLPPRQRAVLILRDVLGWSAAETAELLDTTVTAVNSAVRRARPVVRRHLPTHRLEGADDERALVERYMRALASADDAALLREDVRVSQEPGAGGNAPEAAAWYGGRGAVLAAWAPALDGLEWRFVVTAANRQPALGVYVRPIGTAGDFRAFGLTVLRIEEGRVAEVTVFSNDVFGAFDLPPKIDPSREV